LGRTHSEEVRKAMSESRMGANNPIYGKTVFEETRAKMSESAGLMIVTQVLLLKY
jgi:NUMOD3 motif